MFGYVLPSRDRLDERERERFRAVYCGLCHTLRERYGFAASLLLNYDFTLLAILLSSGDEESCTVRRCAVHPCKGCRASTRRCGCISKRSRRWRMRAAPLLIWRQSPSRR